MVRGGYGISYFTGINGYTAGTLSTQLPVVGNLQVGSTNDFVVDGNLSTIPGIRTFPIPANGISKSRARPSFISPSTTNIPSYRAFTSRCRSGSGGRTFSTLHTLVGALGRRLPVQYDANAAAPGTGNNGRPLFASFGRTATANVRAYQSNNNYHLFFMRMCCWHWPRLRHINFGCNSSWRNL